MNNGKNENQEFLKAFRLGRAAIAAKGTPLRPQGGVHCVEGVGGRRGRRRRRAQARKAGVL